MTDQLLRIKAWDSDLEEETTAGAAEIEKNGRDDAVDKQGHVQKVQKLIYAAKVFRLVNCHDLGLLKTRVGDKSSF